jgi:hypothetical protein
MNFYFDESGDFRLDDDGVRRVGIVVGITIPESVEPEVFARFDDFVASLSSSAFNNNEPKGKLLSYEERTRFAELIAESDKVVVTPAMLDITSINRAKKDVKGNLVRRMHKLADQCIHDKMREESRLLGNQFQNLSNNQALRLASVAYCIKRAFEQTIILLAGKEYFDCWENIRFVIDSVQKRPGGREQQVFKWTMLAWLQAWSQKCPTMMITEIHTQEHPLIKNYSTSNDKFDLNKIYKDNLHYERSSDSKGIQIADMAASIISHAVCRLVTFDNLMNYGLLLKNNLWAAECCHGLFCLTDPSDVDYSYYQGLTEAVAKVRGGDEWRSIVRQRLCV